MDLEIFFHLYSDWPFSVDIQLSQSDLLVVDTPRPSGLRHWKNIPHVRVVYVRNVVQDKKFSFF
jgi:hypothetical protein